MRKKRPTGLPKEHKSSFRKSRPLGKNEKKPPDYVNNIDFYKALVVYKKDVRKAKRNKTPLPVIPDYIGECLLLIANKLSNHPWFCRYTAHWKEEMIGCGIENAVCYLDNFDPKKSKNPFAYYTQIIYFSFRRTIEKEKKQQYVKLKSIENHFNLNDLVNEDVLYENNQNFIKNYEKNLNEKRKKGPTRTRKVTDV